MTRVDGRVERGNRTRRAVLRRAVDIASVEGLEALSVGRLAGELELSKSGVFALFGSKLELQLATVREASRIFVAEVLEPASAGAEGLARLRDLCEGWLRYSERRVFPGGCFFYGVMAEFDAREGAVHDALVAAQRAWLAELERCAEQARVAGELGADTDPAQLAFEVVALMEAANAMSVLHGEPGPYVRARRGIAARLGA
ncbi:TetR family transcriptional regulator C-terminal domain-containing protein [Streptomyces pseudovenezuelae]|uniref:TetR family transcriptional regulator C-terminal domain-containing protein n=1 Tax=Streptomyces pseudovenezuelae TaxID=67350 RepID=UPI0036E2C5F5